MFPIQFRANPMPNSPTTHHFPTQTSSGPFFSFLFFSVAPLPVLLSRPGHGSPDPNNPTQPVRKKPDPTRPELRGGWARAVFFDPQQSTGRARAVIFDPKPDPTRKTRPKGQKTRPNPKKTRPDTPAQGARANPTRPGDRYGSGAGRPMRPVTRP